MTGESKDVHANAASVPPGTSGETRTRWLAQLLSIEQADRPRAETAAREIYAAAGFAPPRYVFWFDSPFDACWANALLNAPHSSIWPQMLAGLAQIRTHREKIEQVRAQLCRSAAENNWDALVAAVGRPMGSHVGPPKGPLPSGTTSIAFEVIGARMQLYGKGYDGIDRRVPSEIETLREDLLTF